MSATVLEAERVSQDEAREHYMSGGAVIVTGQDRGPTTHVHPSSVVHMPAADTVRADGWRSLSEQVAAYGDPRQTFYRVPDMALCAWCQRPVAGVEWCMETAMEDDDTGVYAVCHGCDPAERVSA